MITCLLTRDTGYSAQLGIKELLDQMLPMGYVFFEWSNKSHALSHLWPCFRNPSSGSIIDDVMPRFHMATCCFSHEEVVPYVSGSLPGVSLRDLSHLRCLFLIMVETLCFCPHTYISSWLLILCASRELLIARGYFRSRVSSWGSSSREARFLNHVS